MLDPELRVIAASDAYVRATKVPREEMLGRRVLEVFPAKSADPWPALLAHARDSFQRVLLSGTRDVLPVHRHDCPCPASEGGGGEERYWSQVNSPVLAPDGSVTGIIHRIEDVTERVQLQREQAELTQVATALRASAQTARAALDALTGRIAIVDADGHLAVVNARWREFARHHAGAPAAVPEGADFLAACDATGSANPAVAAVASGIREVLDGRRSEFAAEYPCDSATGEGWTQVRVTPLRGLGGALRLAVIALDDVSERIRAQRALAVSERRLAGIVGSAMDAIISVNADGQIVLFNAAAEELFRCPAAAAIGGPIDRFIPARYRAAHARHVRRFVDTGQTSRAMGRMDLIRGLRPDGEEFPIEASVSQVDVGGEIVATVILRDVTERKRLEQEVLDISSREQQRVGQELHDELCPWLAGTEFLSSALAQDLAHESPANAARARKINESLLHALARAHQLAHGLAPPLVATEGLGGALRALAANAEKIYPVRCRLDGLEPPALPDGVALHLYRIAQEAISNAVRHGGAREVHLRLRSDRFATSVQIHDDGRGFPPALAPSAGMGLRIMRYRTEIIGAKLEIRSGVTGGTAVICTLPAEP